VPPGGEVHGVSAAPSLACGFRCAAVRASNPRSEPQAGPCIAAFVHLGRMPPLHESNSSCAGAHC